MSRFFTRLRGPRRLGAVPLASLAGIAMLATLGAGAAEGAANSTTIGQAAASTGTWCPVGWSWAQTSTSAGAPSYVVPEGGGRITSWSTQGSGGKDGRMSLEVWRPLATPQTFELVGISPAESTVADILNTFTLADPIVVQPGDILGLYNDAYNNCVLETGDDGSTVMESLGRPEPGASLTLPDTGSAQQLNIAASVEPLEVPAVGTTTTLSSDGSPSHLGDPVVLTATVAADSGSEVPTGTVQFLDGTTSLGEAPLDGSGSASLTVGDLAVGPHSLTAVYVPDANGFTGSTSGAWTQQVDYAWSGVLQPVNANGSSVFRAGSTVPVKFALIGASGGAEGVSARLSYSKVGDGSDGAVTEAATKVAATTGNLFRYDATADRYIYNWSTKGLSPGAYTLTIDLGDGAVHTVGLSLR